MKIAIGSDHAGFELKSEIIKFLEVEGYEVEDLGPTDDKSVDYPIYAKKVANYVIDNEHSLGILVCGSGVGVSIVANKIKGIRAVVCSEPLSAKFSRLHNNANVLAIGARIVGVEMAKEIVKVWLNEEFLKGRHAERVNMIADIENIII